MSFAAPLGTIPKIEEENLRLLFDFRSDLWSSPYTYKDSPVRLLGSNILIPLYIADSWSVSTRIFTESLNLGRSEFHLGGEDIFVGTALREEGLGFGARKSFSDGAKLSVLATIATASDVPWGDPRNDYIDASIVYQAAGDENYHWIFAVNQSNNRGIYNGIPFLLVGIVNDRDPEFRYSFGLPFLHLEWGRRGDWNKYFDLTPFGIKLGANKPLKHEFVFATHAALTVRSYMFDTRKDDADRLYYQEIAVEGSFTKFVTSWTGVTFAFGAAMDRRLYESERIYHPNSKVMSIKNDFYGRLGVEFKL